jgi:hypothetical protein
MRLAYSEKVISDDLRAKVRPRTLWHVEGSGTLHEQIFSLRQASVCKLFNSEVSLMVEKSGQQQ